MMKLCTHRVIRWRLLALLLIATLIAPGAADPRSTRHPVRHAPGAKPVDDHGAVDRCQGNPVLYARLHGQKSGAQGDDSLKVRRGGPRLPAWHSRLSHPLAGRRQQPATFTVGNLPEVAEVEPNTSFEKPQPIPLNVTVSGVVQTEDVDHFVVELKKGDRLTVELEGLRLGNGDQRLFRSVPRDSRRPASKLARQRRRGAFVSQDCLCSLVAPRTASTSFSFARSRSAATATARIACTSARFRGPTAVFPPGGKPGETLQVRWIGDAAGEFAQEITLPTDGKPEAPLRCRRTCMAMAPSPNVLRVSDLPWPNEAGAERRGEDGHLVAPPRPLAMNGIIEQAGRRRFLQVHRQEGAAARRARLCPQAAPLAARCGAQRSQRQGRRDRQQRRHGRPRQLPALHHSGRRRVFRLGPRSAQARRAGVRLSRRNHRSQARRCRCACPSGGNTFPRRSSCRKNNRNAVMVAAQRQNFAGELARRLRGTAAGHDGRGGADARPACTRFPSCSRPRPMPQPAGALVGIVGKPADPKLNVVGQPRPADDARSRAEQRRCLGPQRRAHGHGRRRSKFPTRSTSSQPKAPLVRNGSLDLKVVAKRAEGFTDRFRCACSTTRRASRRRAAS